MKTCFKCQHSEYSSNERCFVCAVKGIGVSIREGTEDIACGDFTLLGRYEGGRKIY